MAIPTNGRKRLSRKAVGSQAAWHEAEPGLLFKLLVSSDETQGAYAIVESIAHPGIGSPVHAHNKESEHFLVLEGTLHVVLDGEPMDLHPGETVSLPRGVPHIWINRSDKPVRKLVFFTPGGFEKLALEMAGAGDVDPGRIISRYGLEILGPQLQLARH
jgi:quercetin dioxygenase-like cupin family protein